MCRSWWRSTQRLLSELLTKKALFSTSDPLLDDEVAALVRMAPDGAIFSRRMVKSASISRARAAAGAVGGAVCSGSKSKIKNQTIPGMELELVSDQGSMGSPLSDAYGRPVPHPSVTPGTAPPADWEQIKLSSGIQQGLLSRCLSSQAPAETPPPAPAGDLFDDEETKS